MDEQPASSEVMAPAPAAVETFQCKQCGREFGSAQALQTHEIRAHKKFWSTYKGGPKPGRKVKAHLGRPRSELNPQYVKYRDRYRRLGLNAKGKPYKRGPYAKPGSRKTGPASKTCPLCSRKFTTRAIMGQHLRTKHGKSLNDFPVNGAMPPELPSRQGSKNPKHKRGSSECPVCHETFSKIYLPNHVRTQHGKTLTELRTWDGITKEPQATERARPRPAAKEGREVIFCPVCGTNIHAVRTAVNFAEQ